MEFGVKYCKHVILSYSSDTPLLSRIYYEDTMKERSLWQAEFYVSKRNDLLIQKVSFTLILFTTP